MQTTLLVTIVAKDFADIHNNTYRRSLFVLIIHNKLLLNQPFGTDKSVLCGRNRGIVGQILALSASVDLELSGVISLVNVALDPELVEGSALQ
jgi:hypothetical protein